MQASEGHHIWAVLEHRVRTLYGTYIHVAAHDAYIRTHRVMLPCYIRIAVPTMGRISRSNEHYIGPSVLPYV